MPLRKSRKCEAAAEFSESFTQLERHSFVRCCCSCFSAWISAKTVFWRDARFSASISCNTVALIECTGAIDGAFGL